VTEYIKGKYKNHQSQLNSDIYSMSDCTTCFSLTGPLWGTCIYKNCTTHNFLNIFKIPVPDDGLV